jgi:ribosomal protein S12 methylthiotransferase accessory factor
MDHSGSDGHVVPQDKGGTAMEMVIDFPGGARVDAHVGGFSIRTDQPPSGGGAGSAPTPFTTFLSTIGTCAGIFVLGFCQQRGIDTTGLRLVQHVELDPVTHLVSAIDLSIELPAGFPEKYAAAVVRAAEQCTVKRHLEHPPTIRVGTALASAEALPGVASGASA